MTKQKIKYLLLSSASLTISAVFIATGIAISSGQAPIWIQAYGYLTVGYGIMSASLLIIAWTKTDTTVLPYAKYAALGFMASFFAASLDVGMISGLEWIGIVVVAILLWIQWYSVKSIKKREVYNKTFESRA